MLAWIRHQPALAGIVVIVCTSSKDPRDIARAYELGANAYLVKPPAMSELIELVKAIDVFWIRWNQFKPSL